MTSMDFLHSSPICICIIHWNRSSRLHHMCPYKADVDKEGRPTLARPCEGLHGRTLLMSSILAPPTVFRLECLVRLIWMVSEMGGRWSYSYCFVKCCLHDQFLHCLDRCTCYVCWWNVFCKISEFVFATQRSDCALLVLSRNDAVPDR